jgi:hypothetical protein
MRKVAFAIAAVGSLLVALPVTAQIYPAPAHHGWDSWWHSGLDNHPHFGWFHYDCGTVTETERLPDGRVITRTIERC